VPAAKGRPLAARQYRVHVESQENEWSARR
jgi:hypothetical protein